MLRCAFLALACAVQIATPLAAQCGAHYPDGWQPRGDTGRSLLDRFEFSLGVQYRIVYEGSTIPGPGGTTADDTKSYDFSRQRMRINLDLAATDVPVGGFVQLEFRGGYGGSIPNVSDPRE